MDTPTISVDIDKARRDAGITEVQLADITQIPRTTLRRKIRNPGTFTVIEFLAIAHALDLPGDALQVAS